MPIYANSAMSLAIEEYVHNARYRMILRMKYCDGCTYDEIAEAVNFSPQHVKAICHRYKDLLISQI